jgi:hypothetical protein
VPDRSDVTTQTVEGVEEVRRGLLGGPHERHDGIVWHGDGESSRLSVAGELHRSADGQRLAARLVIDGNERLDRTADLSRSDKQLRGGQ